MRNHYAKAEFNDSAAVYDAAVADGEPTTFEDDILRARLLLRNDENRAVAFLIRRPPKGKASRQRGEWELLLGAGYSRMRDFERADHHFALAEHALKTAAERAELTHKRGVRWMLDGRPDEAWRCVDEMSRDQSLTTKISREMLRSAIFSQEERYRDSADSLMKAIGHIGKSRERYLEYWFHAVQNLALLARELSFDDAAALARQEVDADVEWPADFDVQHFQALKAVGWCCALRGDMLGCFRYLRLAEKVVPSRAFGVILMLDRWFFARIMGEKNWASDEIAKAEDTAEDVDWNALSGDERVGLLMLAMATSQIDPERGRYYLARYKGLDKIRSPLLLFALDHRLEAMTAHAEGIVRLAARASGAEEALRNAWVIFDRIGYDWRAALTAIRLFQVTKKDRWRHLAEDKLEAFPQSWLATEMRSFDVPKKADSVKLPPMQHKVFSMLCNKMTTAEIAEELALSQHTVRNHLKAVFRAYGVKNRASLVAEAAQRGDLPSSRFEKNR
ncbi:MAG TPA: LuxR C-terminal-related transcriptional regulator [Candidatus Nitrosotalea sp.]|nr:LuxR C-terminal-related transcriptional regulator [Candidatus Nitrosotalea sp.]